jgi:hypothetical protein
MNALDIGRIRQDATDRLKLAEKTEELQRIVDEVYPGYKVLISQNGVAAPRIMKMATANYEFRGNPITLFHGKTQVGQILTVLEDANGRMSLKELFKELHARGSKISMQSLMSYLSKLKKEDKVKNFGTGIWGLPQFIGGPEVFEGGIEQ